MSLGDTGRWDQIEPEMGLADWGKIRYWLDWCHEQGLSVRYGSVFSANPDDQANWVALLGRRDLMAGIELHQRQILRKFSGRICAFDLYGHTLNHQFIEDQLSDVMIRRMFEQATALAPKIPMAIAMDNVLAPILFKKPSSGSTTSNARLSPSTNGPLAFMSRLTLILERSSVAWIG